MFDYGYDTPSPFALALEQLSKLRGRERWLRTAIWVWAVGTIVWVLPIGNWSAANLAPRALGAAGMALALSGGLLMLAYRSLARVKVFDPASVESGVLGLDGFDGPAVPVSAARSAAGGASTGRRR